MTTEQTVAEDVPTFPLKLFVYGTLKKGHRLHGYLKDCKYIRTGHAYGMLLHLGNFPGFLHDNTGMPVYGEVWEVPNKAELDTLDTIEGHPNHYVRKKIRLAGGEEVWTYVYEMYHVVTSTNLSTEFYLIPSGAWVGPTTNKVRFMGYFLKAPPPKTTFAAVAHYRVPGEFSGLIDCITGLILREGWKAEGKPHLVYDHATNTWTNKSLQRTPIIYVPPEVKKVDDWVPYIDPADPGEENAPAKPSTEAA